MSLGMVMLYLVLLLICLVLSALFSSSETAFLSLQRVRLKHEVNTKVKGAEQVARLLEQPGRLLSTILLGNNLVNTAAAALATALAVNVWGQGGVAIVIGLVTVVLLVFAETTPKTIATQHGARLAMFYAAPIEWLSRLLRPAVVVLSWIASAFSRLAGGAPVPRSLAGEEEIRMMISVGRSEGEVEDAEAKMLHKVFDFGDRPVREVMVPRPEVVCIEGGSQFSDFFALYAKSPLSRFPIFQENMDNVTGILAIKDVLMAEAKGTIERTSIIDDLVRPAYFTPETKRIGELFAEMRDRNFQMCVVVDEYGGTAGIVSLSRLVEEVVGPVGNELAGVEKDYEAINAFTFEVDGGMRIEEANAEMELGLPVDDEYDTVAGFILELLGRIPRPNEQLRFDGLKVVITEMRGVKIEKILVTKDGHATTPDQV